MLRRIGLQNFKSWRELDIELAPITLLFGANSSGKTAILQSLLMLKQTARGVDPGQHINFGGTDRDYVNLGSYHDVVYRHDQDSNFGVRLAWDTPGTSYSVGQEGKAKVQRDLKSLTLDVSWGIDEFIYVEKIRYDLEMEDSADESVEMRREGPNEYKVETSVAGQTRKPDFAMHPSYSYIFGRGFFGSEEADRAGLWFPNSSFEDMVDHIQYMGPLRLRPQRRYPLTGVKPEVIEPDGANTIQALIASVRGDRKLFSHVARFLKALGLVEEFTFRPIDHEERVYVAIATIGGVKNSLTDVGFGVSQVLPVVTMLLSAPEKSIILIEQPELHLHPNAQAALADLMLFAAETRNLQLIVESHSEHIVRRLQRRIAEASPAFATPDNVKMYYCQPGDGGSTIEEVDVDRFGQISNWPEKFMGDISGDLHTMLKAALERRSQELESVGSGG